MNATQNRWKGMAVRLGVPSGGLAFVLLSSPAWAADLPVRRAPAAVVPPPQATPAAAPAAVAVPPAVSPVAAVPVVAGFWTGPYVGLMLGYQHQDVHQSENGPGAWPAAVGPRYSDDYSRSSVYGSAFVGYNHMMGSAMLGLEGDVAISPGDASSTGPGGISSTFESRWDASLRLRAGYAVDERVMVFATGGIAFADGQLDIGGRSSSNTHVGWTVGAGVDYAFAERWFGRAEVRYSDYGSQTYSTPYGPVSLDFNNTRIGVGIGFRF